MVLQSCRRFSWTQFLGSQVTILLYPTEGSKGRVILIDRGSHSHTEVIKSKQCCGICRRVLHHSDGVSWVRCNGCKLRVHAECDRTSTNLMKVSEYHERGLFLVANPPKKHSVK